MRDLKSENKNKIQCSVKTFNGYFEIVNTKILSHIPIIKNSYANEELQTLNFLIYYIDLCWPSVFVANQFYFLIYFHLEPHKNAITLNLVCSWKMFWTMKLICNDSLVLTSNKNENTRDNG